MPSEDWPHLAMPFEKFVRRLKELTRLQFDPVLWRQLTEADRVALQQMAQDALNLYYDQLKNNP